MDLGLVGEGDVGVSRLGVGGAGGTEVVWRGRRFWVGMDMQVHAVEKEKGD